MSENLGLPPVMTDYDEYLWRAASLHKAYLRMGAQPAELDGVKGTYFAVWAPNADNVSVIGDFNNWEHGKDNLVLRYETGVWQGFFPGIGPGALYKYAVKPKFGGEVMEKADPYGFAAELRPKTASIVCNLNLHKWQDKDWMERRAKLDIRRSAVNIYEMHLGSWKRGEGNTWLTYREMAEQLVPYIKKMGYTHVELMPVTEHPFDGSWGYQTVGYFAPTSRFGKPEDLMYLIDTLHCNDIGVILDWVPAHFPVDGHALARFDGTCLYEHEDPRQGFHPQWGTYIFNYGRNEVRNFLISSALFWLDRYHVDGLRVDAVASMLYRDYGRQDGEWIPNKYGGRENLEAVDFLRAFNEAIRNEMPGCFTLAEESTAWPRVTGPVNEGGLGFTFKWNMGWMNDTLEYMRHEPIHRKYHHRNITFGMLYQYSEDFVLPLSHDEVVYGKRSLVNKMPGDWWQQRANLRVLNGYMTGYPGKKLLFMGGEFGQWNEWNAQQSLDWHLLENADHQGIQKWNADLNALYRRSKCLWELDNSPGGFRWVQCDDADQSLISFLRYPSGQKEALLFICNFTPVPRHHHRLGVPWEGKWNLELNSDEQEYGGSGVSPEESIAAEPRPWDNLPLSIELTVPPLACIVLSSIAPEEPEPKEESLKPSSKKSGRIKFEHDN